MGKTIVPQMHILVKSENGLIRMEAAKIVELIADRRSISVLISLLNDKEFEIRWIAAEGLIKIGRRSLLPLLKAVRDGESSFFLNKGAHHILLSLLNEKEKGKLRPLIQSLDDYRELGETAPVEASKAIRTIYKKKS
jgi:HEAT repeat protein